MATTLEAHSMRRLRKQRREQGLCAQCGSTSSNYLCVRCKDKRDESKNKRISSRSALNQCLSCGRGEPYQEGICKPCMEKRQLLYPNLPIRKLRTWEVTNKRLYDLMMAKSCRTTELAQAVGVSERTVLRWLFQDATPHKDTAALVASYFELSLVELFPIYMIGT